MVMGNAAWSIMVYPNLSLALEEYNIGLKQLVPVQQHSSKFDYIWSIGTNI
jgi:hypothetical protein